MRRRARRATRESCVGRAVRYRINIVVAGGTYTRAGRARGGTRTTGDGRRGLMSAQTIAWGDKNVDSHGGMQNAGVAHPIHVPFE